MLSAEVLMAERLRTIKTTLVKSDVKYFCYWRVGMSRLNNRQRGGIFCRCYITK